MTTSTSSEDIRPRQGGGRLRLVLFDAFDTLITPRLPIHVQYAEEAHKAGLGDVNPDSVRAAFKSAFREVSRLHPEYGRNSQPPLTPHEWWTLLIEECMRGAGAQEDALKAAMPSLGPSLLHRFESAEGYRAFEDVTPALTALAEMGIKTALVSNADDRIRYEKPDARIFQLACDRAGVSISRKTLSATPAGTLSESGQKIPPSEEDDPTDQGIIMIGDELEADYHGALSAGIGARLLRRQGEWSDGAKRKSEDEERLTEKGVTVIRSLDEVVAEAKRRNFP